MHPLSCFFYFWLDRPGDIHLWQSSKILYCCCLLIVVVGGLLLLLIVDRLQPTRWRSHTDTFLGLFWLLLFVDRCCWLIVAVGWRWSLLLLIVFKGPDDVHTPTPSWVCQQTEPWTTMQCVKMQHLRFETNIALFSCSLARRLLMTFDRSCFSGGRSREAWGDPGTRIHWGQTVRTRSRRGDYHLGQ